MAEDKRFECFNTDPKFKSIPKGARKVKIDKRFKSMFKDKKFNVKYTVDKRGRPVNTTSSEDLRRYYDLESESSDNEENDLEVKCSSDKATSGEISDKLRDLGVDYARGEAKLLEDSSSDDESESEDDENDNIEHKWGELDNDADKTEAATYRLAACNMDWDRIRAVDLMVLLNSFLPAGGVIKSVAIYPSEFGKQRIVEEDTKGPIELVQHEQEETEEGSRYHMEKLRQYQLNRLKYYYAIITFDDVASSNKVYTECDGMEYESTATKIDLRFVPDNMTFDDEPKEICEKLPELNKYEPRFFITTALQQAKVDLTWDETAPDRLELTQKLTSGKSEQVEEALLKKFIAASSSDEASDVESNSDTEDPISKYKALLQNIEEKEAEKRNREVEMEITWDTGIKMDTDKLVKRKMIEKEDKTSFEKYLDKRKEKRKQKRLEKKTKTQDEDSDLPSDIDMSDPYFAEEFNNVEFKKKTKSKRVKEPEDDEESAELQLLLMNEDDSKKHFSLKKIQENEEQSKKKKKRKIADDDFQIDVNDDRFSSIYTSHMYNIDPSDPNFKKTKGMENLMQKIIKERPNKEQVKRRKEGESEHKLSEEAKLSVSVKAIKRKTKALNRKNM